MQRMVTRLGISLLVAGILATGSAPALAQVMVSNVRVERRVNTDLMDISFDLDKGGIRDDIAFPIMLVIVDGTNPVSSASATGDVGQAVTAGTNRQIVWDAAADWDKHKDAKNLDFTVKISGESTVPEGGDATATGWQVIDERWVRNFYADGAITMSDRDTGLMWVFDVAANGAANWGNARSHCNELTYAGHSDWLLPDQDKLTAVAKKQAVFANVRPRWYWSSGTPYPDYGSYYHPYMVLMIHGNLATEHNSSSRWIWPCRVAQ